MLRIGLTFFLTILNALWIAVFLYMKQHPTEEVISPRLTLQENALDLQKIEINFESKEAHVALIKKGQQWFLQDPVEWEANPIAVDNLIQQFVFSKPKLSFKIQDTTDLNRYGLALPLCTLKCSTNDKSHTLLFGQIPDMDNIYVTESGSNDIFVFDAKFLDALSLTPEKWGHPFIFSWDELRGITFDTPQKKLYIAQEQGHWLFKSPITAPIDVERMEVIGQQLTHLEYLRFLKPEETKDWLSRFNQNSETYHLTLQYREKSCTLELLPWDAENNTYVAQRNNEGPLFLFTSNGIERLINAQETLRERSLFNLKIQDMNKMVYNTPTQQMTLQAIEDNKWEIWNNTEAPMGNTQKASLTSIRSFLSALNAIYVEKFLDNPADFSENPIAEITLFFKNDNRHVYFYKRDEDYYLKFEKEPTVFQLAVVDETLFQKTLDDFRNRLIWEWKPNETVSSFKIIASNGTITHITPEEVDISCFSSLRAQKWLEGPIQYPLFNALSYRLEIETVDAQQVHYLYRLEFSDRIGGNLQTAKYRDAYFLLPQNWINALFDILHRPFWESMARTFLSNP